MSKKKIRQMVEHHVAFDYKDGFGSKVNFMTEFLALQQKYPECYVEAWTPEDYNAKTERPLTTREAIIVSSNLYNYADANEGTTWNKVEKYVKKSIKLK